MSVYTIVSFYLFPTCCAAGTRPKSVDGRKYAELPRAHPSSAKLNVDLRPVVVLHSIEKDRAIRLTIFVTPTLGGIDKILIIG